MHNVKLKTSKRNLQTEIYGTRTGEEMISHHDIPPEIAEYTLSNALTNRGSAIVSTAVVCSTTTTLYSPNVMKNEQTARRGS